MEDAVTENFMLTSPNPLMTLKYYIEPKDGIINCDVCGTTNETTTGEMICVGCGESLSEPFCFECGVPLGEGKRYVLEDGYQEFPSPTSLNQDMEVVALSSLGHYCCEEHALLAANEALEYYKSRLTTNEDIPCDHCATCAVPIDADKLSRQVLTLAIEHGPKYDPVITEHRILARFCYTCAGVTFVEL